MGTCFWGEPEDGENLEEAGLAQMPNQTVWLDDLQLPEMPGVEAASMTPCGSGGVWRAH